MLEQGTSYMIWCLFVVPGTDREENLIIQFNHNGITRMTRELTVSSSIRWRTWRSFTLKQNGGWDISVLWEKGDDMELLQTLHVEVK